MSVVALVPAAEREECLGGDFPKALVPVRGVPLLVHAVRGLLAAGCVRRVVVAAPVSHVDTTVRVLDSAGVDACVVAGGPGRTRSVGLALRAAVDEVGDTRIVLVHDAVRAFTPAEVVRAVVAAVAGGAPAAVPVLPVTDTVKRVDPAGLVAGTRDRTCLRLVQTPHGFQLDVLRRACDAALDDDADLVSALGLPVATVPGHPSAMRIATPFDLAVAEAVLA